MNGGLGFPTPTRLNLHFWHTRPAVKGTNQEERLWRMEMTLESAAAVEVFLSLGPDKRTSLALCFSSTSWLRASRRELFIFFVTRRGETGKKGEKNSENIHESA